ncbi:NYN domain-containing protein [Candidatus Pacearchaeota archaeon]|nr:NYN domain-containing protein [Candidatus Pacearchaeota archaeon]
MEDCIIFIDGAYLSLISKFIGKGKPLKININKFVRNLTEKEKLDCKEILYYNCPPFQGEPPTEEQEKRKAGYDKFIIKLIKTGIKVREGRCQMIDKRYTQKGVDVLLSIDLIKRAIKSNVKNFIMVACDTDFVPAIKEIRKEEGINVILYYFKDEDSKFSMSDHILGVCDKKVRLKKEDFEKSRF